MAMLEERIYDIGVGIIEPSQVTDAERDEFVNLFSKPNMTNIDTIARLHQRAGADLATIQEEIKALKEVEATFKAFQKVAEEGMTRYCDNKINTRVTKGFTFGVKETKAAEITNEQLIPEEYQKEEKKIVINKALILSDLKQGKEIPGATLKVNKKVSFKENEAY